MQQTNRFLETESKVDTIEDLNQSVNKTKASAKQCKFCGNNHPYDRTKCPASDKTCLKCGRQGHFALKCQEKNRVSCAQANKGTPHKCNARICRRWQVSLWHWWVRVSIFVAEHVGVVSSNIGKSSFMVPLTFYTEYIPIITTQLDTGATQSAMSSTNPLNILQSGEVKLVPPGGKIRLSDGHVVEPLGSYTLKVSWTVAQDATHASSKAGYL